MSGPTPTRVRWPTLESLFVATFGLLGLRIGLRPLGDNSLFIHLRTGIDMVRTGHVPRVDPYSFTAGGQPWVVQSWLASLTYGIAERLGGLPLVRIEQGLLYGVLAWLMARLARTGSARHTALAGAVSIGMGIAFWSPRPLAFGLVGLALTIVIVEERRPWWLLVPVVWCWVNSHGSFVLGLGWLVLVAAGERLDDRRRPAVLPWIGGFAVGLVAAAVNPLGPRLLAFPASVLTKREAFAHVVEWRSADFSTPAGMVTLVALGLLVIVVARRATAWRDVLPLVAFVVAGLAAQRNLPMAAVVAAPVLGRALAARRPSPGGRLPAHGLVLGALALLAAVFVAGAGRQNALDLEGYPVAAARLRPAGTRVLTTDTAAGYLILAEGRGAQVFIDDRVDLYPVAQTADYVRIQAGRGGALGLLDHYDVETVVWEDGTPLSRATRRQQALAASGIS